MFASRGFRLASLLASLVLVFSMATVDQAEARRGGSFGSRGTRTFQAPAPTNTAPMTTPPVQRSMTQQNNAATPAANAAQTRGFGSGLGGAMLRGLMFGGLLGLLFGAGFGGFGGMLALLAQVAIIGGLIYLAMRFFRPSPAGGRRATAGGPSVNAYEAPYRDNGPAASQRYGAGPSTTSSRKPGNPDEIGVSQADLETFESMLARVQAAFTQENYAALRALTTPEMMSYLSEELGNNATAGVKNEVADVKLLQGDLSEAWREGNVEYATAAMRYSSVDVTRERASGRVVDGDPDRATEATELWTFTRPRGGDWKLSAIQEA
ncbi:Tim44 domain-containing protein [Paradevosia shaoguanensis]|uniref:Tim44 domain-containing protein n=1 Tax=Paradevosia shaoguanensis TaxID=1335043 RepID=UPI003C72A4B1